MGQAKQRKQRGDTDQESSARPAEAEPAKDVGEGSEAGSVEEPTREVGDKELGTKEDKGKETELGATVEEPAKDVGETGVKLSKGTGRDEGPPTADKQTGAGAPAQGPDVGEAKETA